MGLKEDFEKKKNQLAEDISETTDSIQDSVKSGVSKTKSFLKKLLIYSLIGAVLAGGLYMLWCNWTYSEGTRTGILVKISKKGYIFKTCEGQLNLGGFNSESGEAFIGNTWSFSVNEDYLHPKLEQLEGKKVMIRYKEINKAMPWQGDTNYMVYDVEERK